MPVVLFMEKWQEELTASIRTIEDLRIFLPVSETSPLFEVVARARMSITPHTAKLIDWSNPSDPLFLMSVPNEQELVFTEGELNDPVGDKLCSPLPFLLRKYEDRVLVQVSFMCPQYCRFCFRRARTGCATPGPTAADREHIREYLAAFPKIKEVILSGGEPLLLSDRQIREWFEMIRSVSHFPPPCQGGGGRKVRTRVHTRVPVTLPSRITPELVFLLSEFNVAVIAHFNHPREIATENVEAIKRLVEIGLVVKNQSVLLRGVNDSTEVLRELIEKLGVLGVSQHAIHHLDAAKGTSRFCVLLARGMEIVRGLGELAPPYYLERPDGKGKVVLL